MGNYQNRENRFVIDGRVQKYFGKELARLDFELDYCTHNVYVTLSIQMVVYWDGYEHGQCMRPSLDKLIQALDQRYHKTLENFESGTTHIP